MGVEGSLDGRTILVTGGARRVGAVIARRLAARGARVIVHYRSGSAEAERLVAELGRGAFAVGSDLTRSDASGSLVAACVQAGAPPDGLVHAAASFLRRPPLQTTAAEWDAVFHLNLRSFYLLAREIVLAGSEASADRGGDLVAIGDAAGLELWPTYLAHSVSKAALIALVKGLAKALAPSWRVNAVIPGTVLPPEGVSPSQRARLEKRTLTGRIGAPEDVARAVEFLLATPFATGSTIEVTGGSELWRPDSTSTSR